MLRAIFLVVSGMSLAPFLLAVACDLPVFGISLQFLAVILGAALTLTRRLAADKLLRTIDRRQKRTLAVGTTVRLAQAVSSAMRSIF